MIEMARSSLLLSAAVFVTVSALCGQETLGPEIHEEAGRGQANHAAVQSLSNLPLTFVENRGQVDERALFIARRGGMTGYFTRNAFVMQLTRGEDLCASEVSQSDEPIGANVFLTFEATCETTVVKGIKELPGRFHYLHGNDPAKWQTDLRSYSGIRYQELYPGVDVEVREGESGCFEYDLILAPGADLTRVVVHCEGADALWVDEEGALIIRTAAGPIEQLKPHTYEVAPSGDCLPVDCSFRLLGTNCFGFEVPGRQAALPLVVDPGLVFSTFLGGIQEEFVNDSPLAVTASGAVVVGGTTTSPDFPTTPGAYDTTASGSDAFVTKLNASGSALVWSTFVTGCSPSGLALDASGAVVVAGSVFSGSGFPTTPGAYDTTLNGSTDGFVAKLNSSGSALVWSTFLGGSGSDSAKAPALDASGAVIVAGRTSSSDFPTTPGAYDTTYNGSGDVIVAKLNATGSALVWSTFLGGSSGEFAEDMVLDLSGSGIVALTGSTSSSDFPTTPGAYDTTYNGGTEDAFVAQLTATGSSLVWSTFLGGSSNDHAYALAVDASGNVSVTGITSSSDFPTTPGALDTTYGGNIDVFVAQLTATGSALAWSTFLGGFQEDRGHALALDAAGNVVVGGGTVSSDFPTTPGAYDTTHNGNVDVFVTKLHMTGSPILWSTFLGGSGIESASALARDASGSVVVFGQTSSSSFPTTPGAYETSYRGGSTDVFVAKLVPFDCSADASWTNYGSGWPGTQGVPSFTASADPVFCTSITLDIGNSRGTSTVGALFIGVGRASIPTSLGGSLLVAPPWVILLISLPGAGLSLPVTVTCDPLFCGIEVDLQCLESDPGASRGTSFTRGLALLHGG